MKHIRTFENYRTKSKREEIIKESVFQVNDIYKVKTMIDIPQSLINAYVKKVKDTTGKNLRQFFGDVDIAEEIVKYINMNNLDVEKIPGGALMGGQVQPQAQTEAQTEVQPQAQTEVQTEVKPEAQVQTEVQTEVKPEAQGEEFEEPKAQSQEETQGQAQEETQGQAQEETEEETEGQAQEETEEGGEELPA